MYIFDTFIVFLVLLTKIYSLKPKLMLCIGKNTRAEFIFELLFKLLYIPHSFFTTNYSGILKVIFLFIVSDIVSTLTDLKC